MRLAPLTFTFGLMNPAIYITCLVALVGGVASAHSAVDADGYNEYTIRPHHVPHDAPRFEDYSVELYDGPLAAPDIRHSARSRTFRTRLRDWAKSKPNFAGHYVLATWGCGTDCTSLAIIDSISGEIFHPTGATYNVAVNIHHSLLEGGSSWHGGGAIQYRANSRLLLLIGNPEEKKARGLFYYKWEDNKLKRVRFVATPMFPWDQ